MSDPVRDRFGTVVDHISRASTSYNDDMETCCSELRIAREKLLVLEADMVAVKDAQKRVR